MGAHVVPGPPLQQDKEKDKASKSSASIFISPPRTSCLLLICPELPVSATVCLCGLASLEMQKVDSNWPELELGWGRNPGGTQRSLCPDLAIQMQISLSRMVCICVEVQFEL